MCIQKTSLRKNSLKFDKCLMLDVDMCAYHVLVLVAQPFAIELSTFHPREMPVTIVWTNTFTF